MPRRSGTPGRKLCTSTSATSHESQQHCETLRALQIEHDALLAAIDAEERAILRLQRRRILAQVVAIGRLDLDDVRALVGQQRAAVRARDVRAQVEHAHAAERTGAVRSVARWRKVRKLSLCIPARAASTSAARCGRDVHPRDSKERTSAPADRAASGATSGPSASAAGTVSSHVASVGVGTRSVSSIL